MVLETYEICVHGQSGNPNFYKVEIYLDWLFIPEIYKIPNFVKIVRAVLEIYENCDKVKIF